MKNDIIVIGAGLGGLVSGAKLAKEGKKVLLIEQHTIPGGVQQYSSGKDIHLKLVFMKWMDYMKMISK